MSLTDERIKELGGWTCPGCRRHYPNTVDLCSSPSMTYYRPGHPKQQPQERLAPDALRIAEGETK